MINKGGHIKMQSYKNLLIKVGVSLESSRPLIEEEPQNTHLY